jgi:two-component system, cell cycle sensor histidine kinase and response regulator CckA
MVDRLRAGYPVSRSLLILASLLVVVILFGGYGYYHVEAVRINEDKYLELAAIGELKSVQIQQWRQERLADVRRPTRSPFFRRSMAVWQRSGFSPTLRTEWQERLQSERSAGFDDALIVTPAAKILLSAVEHPDPISPATQAAITTALVSRDAVLSDFYICPQGRVHIDAIAPVLDAHDKPLAVLIQRSSADTFLFPLVQSWPIPSKTAESLLVQRFDNEVLLLNGLRHRRGTALSIRFPLTRTDLPAVQAVQGKRGLFRGHDYRGVEVLADLRPINDSPWYLVAKVDADELLAEARYRAIIAALVTLCLLVLAALSLGYGHRYQQTGLFKELYQIERRQREEGEEFRTILYSIGDAVITTDNAGIVQRMNQVAEQLTGWLEVEARGMPLSLVFCIINESTRAIVENPVEVVLREGRVVGLANHTLLIARDGRERPIDDSGAPVRDEDGVLRGVVLVFRDVSFQKQAERELQANTDRLHSVFRVAPIGIGVVLDRVFLEVNPKFCEMTGYAEHELLGQNTRVLYQSEEEFVCVGQEQAQQLRVKGAFSTETVWLRRDGSVMDVFLATTPLDLSDPAKGLTFAAVEFTELKQAREDRATMEAQLQQAQKMEAVGRLAGGVAHDFNNMLNVILGYAELARQKLDPDNPVSEYLKEISHAGQRSSDLTRQLLAFARKQTIMPKILDLNDTIAGLLKMLMRLIGEDISLHWSPTAAPVLVTMDPAQIDQILANLVVNARDAVVGVGLITIETAIANLDAAYCDRHVGYIPGEYAVLVVSDTGCGMSREIIDHLFEPFFTTKELGKGTGLGLATVYGIVKQNNGFINVYSEPGCGTTVRIYLPRASSPATAQQECLVPEKELPRGTETILLVEDEASLLAVTVEMLEDLGYRVLACEGPGRALQVAEEGTVVIDLLVSDVVMPEMSGRDLYERLEVYFPNLACLYMSGYTADVIAHHGVLHEGIHFLQKPFSSRDLAIKVREALTL